MAALDEYLLSEAPVLEGGEHFRMRPAPDLSSVRGHGTSVGPKICGVQIPWGSALTVYQEPRDKVYNPGTGMVAARIIEEHFSLFMTEDNYHAWQQAEQTDNQ